MSGTNLLHFLLSSRGARNLFTRACSLVHRFGFSPTKMESALNQWLNISRKFGVRASFPVTAIIVKRYPKVIKGLQDRGLEFAVHGYTHIDYSSLGMKEQMRHFTDAMRIFKSTAISFDGFRAPYTRWNDSTMKAIQTLDFRWDSSKTVIWDVLNKIQNPKSKVQIKKALDLYKPCSARDKPVLPELNNGWVEIPLCLPDDEMLVDRLGFSCKRIQEVWGHILDQTYARGELFTLQLHPERIPLCKEAIESVIRRAQKYNSKIWIASLSEIADWWKEKAKFNAEVKALGQNRYKILFNCSPRATILLKNVEIVQACQGHKVRDITTETWYNSYQKVLINQDRVSTPVLELDIQSKVYPLIVVESNGSNVGTQHAMSLQKNPDAPIIWLWRWPYGARSCLSITGDIDALTLVDFLMRVVGK